MVTSSGLILRVVVILLMLAGVLVGIYVGNLAARSEQGRIELEFDSYLESRISYLDEEYATLVEVLASLKSLFECSQTVTRDEFGRFADGALARHQAVQALEWIPRVTEEERVSHQNSMRAEGLAGYRITEQGRDGGLVPAASRTEYFPVNMVEPLAGNVRAVGFDLNSEELRSRALARALANGTAAMSDPVDLVQGDGSTSGALIFLALSGPEGPVGADGQELSSGLVVLVFRLADLFAESLLRADFAGGGRPGAELEFRLRDVDVGGSPRILHVTPGFIAAESEETDLHVRLIELGGQIWELEAIPAAGFIAARSTLNPVGFGAGAALIWEMLILMLAALWRWARSKLVKRQTRMIRAVLGSMSEGVVVADRDGNIVMANAAARKLSGLRESDYCTRDWRRRFNCYLPDMTTPMPAESLPMSRAIAGRDVREEVIYIKNSEAATGAWISVNGCPLREADGSLIGGVIVFRDITERKRANDVVERLYNAVEHTDDIVFITGRDGVIHYVNAAFERTTGYSREEAVGQTPRLLKSGSQDQAHYKELWGTILAGNVFRKIIVNRRKNGETFQGDQTITPMRGHGGKVTHFVSVIKDMTELLRMERREAELDLASQVQRKLYPIEPPSLPGIDIAGTVLSADSTCGDYYDYIEMADGSLGLVVGDVSGHGIAPAMVMVQTRAYLRSLCATCTDLTSIFGQINRALEADLENHRFVTLLLVRIDPEARLLEHASAGHEAGFVIDAAGGIKATLGSTGMPLGILADSGYAAGARVKLESGDLILMVTDGLTDSQAHNDRFLEIEDCLALVAEHRQESSQKIIDSLHAKVAEFSGDDTQYDDITIIVCKIL